MFIKKKKHFYSKPRIQLTTIMILYSIQYSIYGRVSNSMPIAAFIVNLILYFSWNEICSCMNCDQ